MTLLEELHGWRIRRIDGPTPGLWALTLRGPGRERGALLLSTVGGVDWGMVSERPRGRPASSFVQLLRKHLDNALVERVEVGDDHLLIDTRRGSHRARLALRDASIAIEAEGRTLGTRPDPGPPSHASGPRPRTLEALRERGPSLRARILGAGVEARRRALKKAVKRRIAQLRRRLRKIEADLERVEQVDGLRARGSAILAELARLPQDASEVVVTDWAADPPREITIPIGEGRTPREEAERIFHRARKLERGAEIAVERHALTEREIAALEELLPDLADAGADALDQLRERAREHGARLPTGPGSRASATRRAHRTFRGAGGAAILVGRSARDNDTLTLSARPWDHWLHARGVPGSHVVVPLQRGEAIGPELLIDAAHLAAHFSQNRGEERVEITHAPRRYVRKPRGFPPGAVRVEREKTILLRVEPTRLESLLASGAKS